MTNNQISITNNEDFNYMSLLPKEATRWSICYFYMKILNDPVESEWYEKNFNIKKCMEHFKMKETQYNLIKRVFIKFRDAMNKKEPINVKIKNKNKRTKIIIGSEKSQIISNTIENNCSYRETTE